MIEFIETISRDLAHEDFYKRNTANLALLAYDLGRAKNDTERDNARKEWVFRMLAFEALGGLKHTMKRLRK